MLDMELNAEVDAENLSEDLSDEALDRESGQKFCDWCHVTCYRGER